MFFLVFFGTPPGKCKLLVETLPFPEEVQNQTKASSSTSKQKHIFTFDKNPIDSSCFHVPDSGFKFQDLAVARRTLVHSTATYKDRGKVRYLQCFLLGYGSLSTLQDAPGELQKLLGWILGGGGDHTDIYPCTISTYVRIQTCMYASVQICKRVCMPACLLACVMHVHRHTRTYVCMHAK